MPAVEIRVTQLKEWQRLFIQLLQMMSFDWIGGNRDVMISHWVSGVLSVLKMSNFSYNLFHNLRWNLFWQIPPTYTRSDLGSQRTPPGNELLKTSEGQRENRDLLIFHSSSHSSLPLVKSPGKHPRATNKTLLHLLPLSVPHCFFCLWLLQPGARLDASAADTETRLQYV